MHEIYWKADTVGIEGHDDLSAAFDPGSIVAVSGCYDSSRKRYIIAVGLADGTVRQVYWKPFTVGVEANSVVAKLTANSIVGVSAFLTASATTSITLSLPVRRPPSGVLGCGGRLTKDTRFNAVFRGTIGCAGT
jgi:hypothetical protein